MVTRKTTPVKRAGFEADLLALVGRAAERDARTGSGDMRDFGLTVARAAYRLGFARGKPSIAKRSARQPEQLLSGLQTLLVTFDEDRAAGRHATRSELSNVNAVRRWREEATRIVSKL